MCHFVLLVSAVSPTVRLYSGADSSSGRNLPSVACSRIHHCPPLPVGNMITAISYLARQIKAKNLSDMKSKKKVKVMMLITVLGILYTWIRWVVFTESFSTGKSLNESFDPLIPIASLWMDSRNEDISSERKRLKSEIRVPRRAGGGRAIWEWIQI